MGVLSVVSSFLGTHGELTIGLRSSEGNVPDPGVGRDDTVTVGLLSKPAAAMVADEVAAAIVGRCRLWKIKTEESNE